MTTQVDIQPRELKFIVELNKQSKCMVQLLNKTHQYLAFKVKTTSPKKYCVRPNVGIIQPKAVHEFVVIMQAQKTALVDLTCKDKFLIQTTIVPEGTMDEDITSEMFSKEGGKYIEESKLRVFLASPPLLSELSSVNGTAKQVAEHMESKTVNNEELKPVKSANDELKHVKSANDELKHVKSANEDLKLLKSANDELKHVKSANDELMHVKSANEELKPVKSAEVEPIQEVKLEPIKNMKLEPTMMMDSSVVKVVESKLAKDVQPVTRINDEAEVIEPRIPVVEENKLFKDIEEMKLKLYEFESKLSKAEAIISKLTDEGRLVVQDRDSLQQELDLLRKRKVRRRVHDGFPLLFVCMVALISLLVGYGFHP